MPGTAAMLGINNYSMPQNIEGGVRYLAQLLNTFAWAGAWQQSFAVAAYNAGPGAIYQYGGIPPYDETRNYVRCVGAIYKRLINIMMYS
jgi:soluble lytic murein transglycosylase-like protein